MFFFFGVEAGRGSENRGRPRLSVCRQSTPRQVLLCISFSFSLVSFLHFNFFDTFWFSFHVRPYQPFILFVNYNIAF